MSVFRCQACEELESRIAILERVIAASPSTSQPPPSTSGIDPTALYTSKEVAAIFRSGLSSVYHLLESGQLAVTRTGTRKGFRVRGADILAFIESRVEGGPEVRLPLKHVKM